MKRRIKGNNDFNSGDAYRGNVTGGAGDGSSTGGSMYSGSDGSDSNADVQIKKIIMYVIALLVFLGVTNPTLIPFLPTKWKNRIELAWKSLFGDVGEISHIFKFNWLVVFKLIAMIFMVVIVTKIVSFVLEHLRVRNGKTKSIISMLRSAIGYISTIIAVLWGLTILGVNISTIFAGVGVMALVIGFGAEALISDVVTGIFLVFENQFSIGDIIEIGDFRGEVIQIGIRTTHVRDIANNVKIINNSEIRNVLNRSSAYSVVAIDVPIAYEERLVKVEALFSELLPAIGERHPEMFITAPKYLGVQELADSAVLLRVIAEVRDADIYNAPRVMNREIKLALDEAGIEIPFQQIVIHKAE
ncbi:MAG: mechanosensitive ion channel family protein [Eubacteriales bacterium]|nr:mechanosensitive ion channel family protein [Eubacteriales bacterium]